MGATWDMVCHDCKEKLWIGQRGAGSEEPWIYRGDKHLSELDAFLVKHKFHHLEYTLEDGIEALDDYADFSDRQQGE